MQESFETQKRHAAKCAALKIPPNVRIGLGSGSTSEFFIEELAQIPHASTLTLVSSSDASKALAEKLGLKVNELTTCDQLDIAVDGADAVDTEGNLLKGFGGALTREKIVASLAKELWILVDERKRKQHLPLDRIPCEILPCAKQLLMNLLKKRGFEGTLRTRSSSREPTNKSNSDLWITDNGGWILDVDLKQEKTDLAKLDTWLHSLPGLIETGLFLGFNVRLFDGSPQNHLLA
jgi:ribose 5-phosphate isomerase A